MKTIKNFLLNLQFIFKPSYWLMQAPYSKTWDMKLNELLDKWEFKQIDRYTATLGGIEIWIANHPYASFVPFDVAIKREIGFRPSRLTIQKANRKLRGEDILFEKYVSKTLQELGL